jgi:glucose-1-phosphate thymidylyltransferase
MRSADASAQLDESQTRAADAGVKGMIPIGRPFLDYVISGLADAGITDVCLVIGPEHQRIRDYYGSEVELQRVRVHFATQAKPLGTADAVLAVEEFANDGHVLVLNSDNYYPVASLRALAELGAAGVAAFERDALVLLSNIDAARVAKYSVIEIDDDGLLVRIVEKPDPRTMAGLGGGPIVFVGMNSWSLPPEIYRACRSIALSTRGELELPDAVQFARDHLGVPFHVLTFHAGVLDLSSRGDIASVALRLRNVEPRL